MMRVVVVEDHTLVRQSLVKAVRAEAGFSVVGEAGTGREAVRVVAETGPDLVLLDIAMPEGDGLDVAASVRRTAPGVKILFLTMHDDDASLRGAVAVGADGFVPKSSSMDDLLQALHAVRDGRSYLSPAVARRVMDLASGRQDGRPAHLTDRELEILRLLAQGLRATEVGERLFVSVKTVKNHLTNVYAKLGVSTASQAVAEAYRRGLVSATHVA